jgi:hypothetical protein
MIPEIVWQSTGAAVGAGLIIDLTEHGIQQWQRSRAGIPLETLGVLGRIPLSLLTNFVAFFLFLYTYNAVAAGSGRAYLAGALVWLTITIPVLASSGHVDGGSKGLLTTRVFGWLLKAAAVSTAADFFFG